MKRILIPLASAGWSLPAAGWVSLFVGSGVAIHSTYWHNNYGEPSSRGCVVIDVNSTLMTLVTEQNIRKATVWDTIHLKQLGIANTLQSLGVELASLKADKHEIAQYDLSITEADYLLPETGRLVLRSSAEKPRAVSLLPRIHLAIIRPEMLRADMHQVFAEAKDSNYLVFITGPSRTADIELTVTLGVHGPKNLYVWMMDE